MEEIENGVLGELGWSAESMKLQLTKSDREGRTRRWKDYICESFCDSAGWLFGTARQYSEMTLGRAERDARRRWFREHVVDRRALDIIGFVPFPVRAVAAGLVLAGFLLAGCKTETAKHKGSQARR